MARPLKVHTVESLLARTTEDGDCMLWNGYDNGDETPKVYHQGRMVSVRWLLAVLREERVLEGYWGVSCGSLTCVNPAHAVRRTKAEHFSNMANLLNASASKSAIRKAKISKANSKIPPDKMHIVHDRSLTCRQAAEMLGVSDSTISARRHHGVGELHSSPWAALLNPPKGKP